MTVAITVKSPSRARRFTSATTEGESLAEKQPNSREVSVSADVGALRRVEEILGMATHELRTPLTSGMLAIQLAARHIDSVRARMQPDATDWTADVEPVHQLLMQAADSLGRLNRMMEDLADISHIRTGALSLRLVTCNLASMVSDVVQEHRWLAPDRVIRVRGPARPMRVIIVDRDRIRQVVANYLTNALRYAPCTRPIDVSIRTRSHWIVVAVKDEGPGIPDHERHRIWDRFHRVGQAGQLHESHVTAACGDGNGNGSDTVASAGLGLEVGQGLGLGLYICKTIVEQHHGKVGQHNVAQGGSVFWFALPTSHPRDKSRQGS